MLATTLSIVMSGCATIADPDAVGLYYLKGNSDGYKFGKCIEPGATGDAVWNNEAIYLPTNLRTWIIDDMPDPANPGRYIIAPGADSADVIVVSAAPEEGQPSGVQVRVSTKTNFKLNTYCDANGGKAREFWEAIGRRYDANTEEGRKRLYNAELVPVQKTIIKDVLRAYSANPLIANQEGIQTQAQLKMAKVQAEAVKSCGNNPNCHMFVGNTPGMIFSTK
jgi:hypothetical protein